MHELTRQQIDAFITEGFIRLDRAFPRRLADEAREILWRDLGIDRTNPSTWTEPLVRLGQYGQRPFAEAANTPVLHRAFDQLVGAGRWLPRATLGTFPVRFPAPGDSGDTGWHVDASFATESPDFLSWRVNITSKGRALLMLFLFSDVGPDEAPTRIRAGSHRDVARMLAPAGDRGVSLGELVANHLDETAHRNEVLATGDAGTVYLCHPLLVHAAQPHRGARPRFVAQPPLLPAAPFELSRPDGRYSPVESAIISALGDAVP
jgi:hypothetical protein